jgi:hypothetical protein
MKGIWILGILAVLVTACSNEKNNEEVSADSTEVETTPSLFGAEFDAEDAKDINVIDPSTIAESDSLEAVVYGTVKDVCQVKGCWMTVVSDSDTSQVINVRFKDYGFFVPKDLMGTKIAMNGKAFSEMTPVDELRHYAEDAGKTAEEIEQIIDPEYQLKFYASGVQVMK